MPKYVALLRGIGPSNPNMHQKKLEGVLEELGFSNVKAIISSGNVIFENSSKDQAALETKIEKAWPAKLGFKSMTIVRSQEQLQALVDQKPYKDVPHSRQNYQLVTFFKQTPKGLTANYYTINGVNALCSTINTTSSKTPDFMVKMDKQFGKDQITSRTWKTIQRILQKQAAA